MHTSGLVQVVFTSNAAPLTAPSKLLYSETPRAREMLSWVPILLFTMVCFALATLIVLCEHHHPNQRNAISSDQLTALTGLSQRYRANQQHKVPKAQDEEKGELPPNVTPQAQHRQRPKPLGGRRPRHKSLPPTRRKRYESMPEPANLHPLHPLHENNKKSLSTWSLQTLETQSEKSVYDDTMDDPFSRPIRPLLLPSRRPGRKKQRWASFHSHTPYWVDTLPQQPESPSPSTIPNPVGRKRSSTLA